MGKKRRLNSSKAKFNLKHAQHPRMRHLSKQEKTVEEDIIEAQPEVVIEAQPEAILQEETLEEMPKVAPKRKSTKKASTKKRRPKKTTTPEITA
jgi:hypothetical protein